MRLPKPILEKLLVIYSYQQRYEMFLNIQNNTKKNPHISVRIIAKHVRVSVHEYYPGRGLLFF